MTISIHECDMNNDYFHFTNKSNVNSILNSGLIPSIGAASKLVEDRANVSVSKGGKGIIGIINSFIFKFAGLKASEIPEEYKKYFQEISDFEADTVISKDDVYKAMTRKLKDEVYFRVSLGDKELKQAKVGGLTGYDINLPMAIESSKIDIITNSDNKVLSAYDVAMNIYERAKNISAIRNMHEDFFHMFETGNQNRIKEHNVDDNEIQK